MKQGNSATSSAQNRGSVIRYTLAILSSTFAAFIGGQLVAPIIIAIVASAFFGINESKISDLISNNTYVRFVTILSVEIVTTWFVYRLLKYRHKKFAYIGMSTKPTLKDLGRGLKAYAG